MDRDTNVLSEFSIIVAITNNNDRCYFNELKPIRLTSLSKGATPFVNSTEARKALEENFMYLSGILEYYNISSIIIQNLSIVSDEDSNDTKLLTEEEIFL